ncbi:N-acetylglucosaminyltransferase [Pseudovibrio exalbescens]|uniref:N-acetylglucosaminyltransferase n=1 Tax=Pseudovibrio exalbescens TaxID=197461 RepID=UPI0023668431|nr:N-acetylglucosaminyltransferase [Pseudovibrio exalbescens]MDD7908706.1 N-acetylglucosaminyltransferase [Pseudovibrio exalbescens]
MGRVIDGFTFFNELDVLELRLGELYDVVDQFILVEATQTFTGGAKALFYSDNKERFSAFADKITHVIVSDMPEDAPSAWTREYHQRDAIGRGLPNGAPDDLILVSDVDEIPKPEALEAARADKRSQYGLTWFGTDIFRYRLNYKDDVNDQTSCPRMIARRHFRGAQNLRRERVIRSRSAPKFLEGLMWHASALRKYGRPMHRIIRPSSSWHFSYLGNMDKVLTKVAAYSHTEHMNDAYLGRAERTLKRLDTGDGGSKLIDKNSPELPRYFRENFDRFSDLYVEPQLKEAATTRIDR